MHRVVVNRDRTSCCWSSHFRCSSSSGFLHWQAVVALFSGLGFVGDGGGLGTNIRPKAFHPWYILLTLPCFEATYNSTVRYEQYHSTLV